VALRISAPPRDKSTIWRKLWVVPRTLVAAPSYLARRDTPQHPDQLERHDCLGYSNLAEGAVWDLRQVRTGASTSIALRSCFTCNNGDLLSDLAVRGEGIALLPNFITAPLIADRKLVEVLPDWRAPEIWLAAYYPPYDHIPAKVETFTRFIEANLSHRGHDGA
jgi:DNA-binding transcriptional LysR family regulator